ncbi:hypothetical protein BKA61DRAFT_583797 [Leptodontidium sp. MPI-SDFR-AT-0119]|nr:hypothetical protein BKA61DRAFT_583797 [Leptodontidium sp. MPI-SDFR-AT-0119]
MKLYLYGWISTLIAFALCFPSDGSLSVSSLQARAYLPLVERTNPNVPRAGVTYFVLASSAGTVVRTIFDTNGQWDGALAIDVSAAAMYNLYGARNFLVDYVRPTPLPAFDDSSEKRWVPFTYAAESYFTADPGVQFYMVEIAESALGALGGASANIPLISLRKRTDIISEQVCAKPVDLRSYLRNTIPNLVALLGTLV